jgi:ribonuclease HII
MSLCRKAAISPRLTAASSPTTPNGPPGLAVWKGDQVAACVAAASVLAKVTRDRIMVELAQKYPDYGFDLHKGYTTPEHSAALREHGPCPEHRFSYVNVAESERALDGREEAGRGTVGVASGDPTRRRRRVGEDVVMEDER